MALGRMLGFSLKPVRIDPDGASTPPDPSPLAPPSNPAAASSRLFEKTRIEGLVAPPAELGTAEKAPAQGRSSDQMPALPAAPALPAVTPPAQQRSASVLPTAPLRSVAPVRRGSRALAALAVFSACVGFGSAVVWSRVLRHAAQRSHAHETRAAADEAPSLWQDPRDLASSSCTRQSDPRRVLSDVSASLQLEAHARAGTPEVFIGAGAPNGTAVGLRLNATTLEVAELLREAGSRELLGVVPDTASSAPGFLVDRAVVGGYRDLRTLPDHGALALARTNVGLQLLRRADQRAAALWPLHAGEEISRPRVEWLDPERLIIALRRGGRDGVIALGWLERQTLSRSALRDLPFDGSEIGLPSLAVQSGRAAIAVAVKATPAHAWRVQVATSEWHGNTARVALPELPARPDADTFAPSISSLADSRWLLQWTEGQQGERRVRALTLDSEFRALGSPIAVSPANESAGGGLVVPVDSGLLSLFLVQKPSGYDLWATTLACH